MYRLVKFGTTQLDYYNQVDPVGSGDTPTNYLLLPEGGAIDNFGSQRKYPGVVERVKAQRLQADSADELLTLYYSLLELVGTRDRLFRRSVDGAIQWQYARLVSVNAVREYQQTQFKRIQDLDLRFVTQEPTWRGRLVGTWYFDSGEHFDSGLYFDSGELVTLNTLTKVFTDTIGAGEAGRAPTRNIRIVVTAGATDITAFSIARTGGETLTFGGTIAAGTSLVIDTGSMQVENDGVDAYDDLTFAADADMAVWFSLLPGDNEITVVRTGGDSNSTIEFVYYEAWH